MFNARGSGKEKKRVREKPRAKDLEERERKKTENKQERG